MQQPHVYDWAKKRGFFGRKKAPVSHLLLDGGVLCVPQESSAEFISAYAIGVVKKGRLPCVVETKTPVFRMFYDLDVCMTRDMAAAFVRGEIPDAARPALEIIIDITRRSFDVKTRVIACASDASKTITGTDAGVKLGVHLTFDDIFVTSATAMTVRDRVLDALSSTGNPFDNEWSVIVDSAVFKGSGMRLPWSTKKNETRTYVPIAEYSSGWVSLNSQDISSSVAAARDLVARVSLRSFGQPTPCTIKVDDDYFSGAASSFGMSHASLREYSEVVAKVQELIPSVYGDGHVTAVLRGDHAIIFRHGSRYCANVKRQHNSSNTYFLLTRRGLQQCCYSRKDEDVGRTCLCRDFRGQYIEVPKALTDELFPEESKPEAIPAPMPSRATVSVDAIAGFSRPALKLVAPRQKKTRVRPLSILLGR